jgi:hypothetical protein
MSSLFSDYVDGLRPRTEPFRSRSMGLCLVGHRPFLSMGEKYPASGPESNLPAPMPAISRTRSSVASWLLDCGLLSNYAGLTLWTIFAAEGTFRLHRATS